LMRNGMAAGVADAGGRVTRGRETVGSSKAFSVVMPAKAGIQGTRRLPWTPAFDG
jgi:hypothetical protein